MEAARLVRLLQANGVHKGDEKSRLALAALLIKAVPVLDDAGWSTALRDLYEDFVRTGARAPGHLLTKHLMAGTWRSYLDDIRAEAAARPKIETPRERSSQPDHIMDVEETQEYLQRMRELDKVCDAEREARHAAKAAEAKKGGK
jgi:hypothetical protein